MRPATFWFSVLFQTFEYDCVDLSLFFFLFVQLLAKTLLLGKKKEDEGDAATFCVSRPVGLACGSNLLSHFGFLSSFLCTIDIIWCFGFMTYRPTGATSLFISWIFFCYCFLLAFIWFSAWTRKRCPSPALCVATLTFCWICLILQLKENWLTCRVGGLRLRFVVCLLSVGPKERQTNFLLWKGRS